MHASRRNGGLRMSRPCPVLRTSGRRIGVPDSQLVRSALRWRTRNDAARGAGTSGRTLRPGSRDRLHELGRIVANVANCRTDFPNSTCPPWGVIMATASAGRTTHPVVELALLENKRHAVPLPALTVASTCRRDAENELRWGCSAGSPTLRRGQRAAALPGQVTSLARH